MLTDDNKQWITELLGGLEKIEERIAQVEERFAERLEKVETTLLTEFHKWASPIEMRQRTHTATLRALYEEMEAHSDRVKNHRRALILFPEIPKPKLVE